jgi:hypothetical protein
MKPAEVSFLQRLYYAAGNTAARVSTTALRVVFDLDSQYSGGNLINV